MSWQGRRVLVTGAAGFIGSHLVERLVETGASVRAFVHYNALGTWGWLDESPAREAVEIVAGDICDAGSLRRAARQVETVFHLAALIAIPYSYQAPAAFVRTNVEGTLNVLQAALEEGVSRLIHTSTSEVYGTAQSVPIDERHVLQAQSPYAATKIGADQLAEAFYRSFSLPVTIVRPFNTFGPRQSARAVIPAIISQCLAGGPVRLGNLKPTRDFNYVSNTVDGFLLAAEREAAIGQTIHFGSGREISIGDLAALIGELTGRPVAIEPEAQRQRPALSEVERLLADNRLARRLLDWKPAIGLEEGLRRTIDWIQGHSERFRPSAYVL
jgi:dTDP-glucose 4,6-dehydratase